MKLTNVRWLLDFSFSLFLSIWLLILLRYLHQNLTDYQYRLIAKLGNRAFTRHGNEVYHAKKNNSYITRYVLVFEISFIFFSTPLNMIYRCYHRYQLRKLCLFNWAILVVFTLIFFPVLAQRNWKTPTSTQMKFQAFSKLLRIKFWKFIRFFFIFPYKIGRYTFREKFGFSDKN